MARKGRTKVIYKGTFISKQSLFLDLCSSQYMYMQDLLKWYLLSVCVFFVDSVDYASENSNNSQKQQYQSIGHLSLYLWLRNQLPYFLSPIRTKPCFRWNPMVVFIWSIFIRAVINHMTCYDLNWPKIRFSVYYFVFSCALDHILKR